MKNSLQAQIERFKAISEPERIEAMGILLFSLLTFFAAFFVGYLIAIEFFHG